MTTTLTKSKERCRSLIFNVYSMVKSIKKTSSVLKLPYGTVRYSLERGVAKKKGHRKKVFSDEDQRKITQLLIEIIRMEPSVTRDKVHFYLEFVFNRKFSHGTVFNIFKKLRWSWKIPSVVQIKKFTAKNMTSYAQYVYWSQYIPWDRLKFLDESHISHRHIKHKVLGKKGVRRSVFRNTIHRKSFTITLLLSIVDPHFRVDFREESNTQYDYLTSVNYFCAQGYLNPGDFLICDNWSGHFAKHTYQYLVLISIMELPLFSYRNILQS